MTASVKRLKGRHTVATEDAFLSGNISSFPIRPEGPIRSYLRDTRNEKQRSSLWCHMVDSANQRCKQSKRSLFSLFFCCGFFGFLLWPGLKGAQGHQLSQWQVVGAQAARCVSWVTDHWVIPVTHFAWGMRSPLMGDVTVPTKSSPSLSMTYVL